MDHVTGLEIHYRIAVGVGVGNVNRMYFIAVNMKTHVASKGHDR